MSKDKCSIIDAPLKALTVLVMPLVLGSFFQQVYSIADSVMVGRFVGSSALATIGVYAALTNVFICVALDAGVGAGVPVSRHFRAKEYDKIKAIVSTSLVGFLLLSMYLGIIGFCLSRQALCISQTPDDILDAAVLYLRVYFIDFPFLFMYSILLSMFASIGEFKIPLGLLVFSSAFNAGLDYRMVAKLELDVFGATLAALVAQGIPAVLSLLLSLSRMKHYQGSFRRSDRQELRTMLRIAVPSALQQSTVSVGVMTIQAVVNPSGTQALAGCAATMQVKNVFLLTSVSIGNAVSPSVFQNLDAKRAERIRKGYRAALVLDACFALLMFLIIESLHTHISALSLGKNEAELAYRVFGEYMKWLGYFFLFMGIKMAVGGMLHGLGKMHPLLLANMVNLAIRLPVALSFAPRFNIAFVWLAVPAGWFTDSLTSCITLRKAWPEKKVQS